MADHQRKAPELKNSHYISRRATKRWEFTHRMQSRSLYFFDLQAAREAQSGLATSGGQPCSQPQLATADPARHCGARLHRQTARQAKQSTRVEGASEDVMACAALPVSE